MNILQMNFISSVLIVLMIILRKGKFINISKRNTVVLWQIICISFFVPYSLIIMKAKNALGISINNFSTSIANNSLQNDITLAYVYGVQFIRYFTYVWIIGVVLLSLYFIMMYFIGYCKYRNAEIVSNQITTNRSYNLRLFRTVIIKQSDYTQSPLTYGLLKPVIVLPTFLFDDNDVNWDYILLHEFTHIKNWDVLTKLFVTMVLCIYWFNPLVWIMFYLVNNDIEMACDEDVLSEIGVKNKKKYAEMLVRLAEKNSTYYTNSTGLSNSNLKERVQKIIFYHKTKTLNSIILLSIVCVVIFFPSLLSIKCNNAFNDILIIIPSKQDIISSGYPQNKSGDTYGPNIKDLNDEPDLILVENDDGKIGYIKANEFENTNERIPEKMHEENYKISEMNMYLHDGKTVIGKFNLSK